MKRGPGEYEEEKSAKRTKVDEKAAMPTEIKPTATLWNKLWNNYLIPVLRPFRWQPSREYVHNLISHNTDVPKNLEAIKQLFQWGYDPNSIIGVDGGTLVWVAAHLGSLEMLQLIATQPGVDLNSKWRGGTPLGLAADLSKHENVKYLVDLKGVDLLNPTCFGHCIVHCMVLRAYKEDNLKTIAAILEQHPHLINHYSYRDGTPLSLAICNGRLASELEPQDALNVVKLLLSKGADPRIANPAGITPLAAAAANKNYSAVVEVLTTRLQELVAAEKTVAPVANPLLLSNSLPPLGEKTAEIAAPITELAPAATETTADNRNVL